MSIEELYREKILQHYRNPHHFGKLEQMINQNMPAKYNSKKTLQVNRDNPLCGDQIQLLLTMYDDTLGQIQFYGAGCALCIASASMMCDLVTGKAMPEVENITYDVLMAFNQEIDESILDRYGDITGFKAIIPFPNRSKCAMLAWETLQDAIKLLMPNLENSLLASNARQKETYFVAQNEQNIANNLDEPDQG